MSDAKLALLCLGVILVVAGVMPEDKTVQTEHSHYCDMVAEWDASNGEWGWPPYKGREHCPAK
jgi:hypothetical protein